MSDPAPTTTRTPSKASRYLFVLVAGLVIGVIVSRLTFRWNRRDA